MSFTPQEYEACRRLVNMALEEDLGSVGDLTSQAIIPPDLMGQAVLVARQTGVLAGLPAFQQTFAVVDPALSVECLREDGAQVQSGDQLAIVRGCMRSILTAERTALNFVQRLSGIATLTRRYVDAVAGLPCQIFDTRKTTPGWRLLEKYAVRCGGGHNHRMGLYDGILIKDNHLAALAGHPDSVAEAIRLVWRKYGQTMPVEVEVDTLEQFEVALGAAADAVLIVLLDNIDSAAIRQAFRRRNYSAPRMLLEASGKVTLENVRAIAETGVDRISVGALTHSAPALDIGLDYLP
jgi:nicotinate-nucleotide pyrophosphorylase (carboxylating)